MVNKYRELTKKWVDIVNKYRDIHYKWQIWEKLIKNKEFILALPCTADVMSPPFTSYSTPKTLTIVGTQHIQKVKATSKYADIMFTIFL